MQVTSKQSESTVQTENKKQLPYYYFLRVVENEIKTKREMDIQELNQPSSQRVKIEKSDLTEETETYSIISELSAFKHFKKDQNQDIFSQYSQSTIGSLKNVNTKSLENQFDSFYKLLKRNSTFRHMIPVSTIVLARYEEQKLWPAKILEVKELQAKTKNKKIIYKVELINKNKSVQLFKYSLIKFTSQNLKMLRQFTNDKNLLKNLKIAQKLCQQNQKFWHLGQKIKSNENNFQRKKLVNNILLQEQKMKVSRVLEKIKTLKVENKQKQIKRESYISRISNKTQNNKKWQPLNLMIETPRINPQNFTDQEKSQDESEFVVENDTKVKQHKQQFRDDETCFNQEEKILDSQFFQHLPNAKNIQKDNKEKRNKFNLIKQLTCKLSNSYNRQQLDKIFRCFYDYKLQLKNNSPNRKKKISLDNVLIFLNKPLKSFNEQDIRKYSKIINISIELCQNKSFNLKDFDQSFIQVLKKTLCSIYNTLKNQTQQNVFVQVIRLNFISKLEKLFENVLTEAKIDTIGQNVKLQAKQESQ